MTTSRLTHAVIDEFSGIEEIKGQRSKNVLSAATPRRQIVAKALATCPRDEWIGVDALFTTMRRECLSPTIVRNDMALWKLYLEDPQYGSLGYDGYHRWEILEGRYTWWLGPTRAVRRSWAGRNRHDRLGLGVLTLAPVGTWPQPLTQTTCFSFATISTRSVWLAITSSMFL
jgi:hypothetical protein